MIGGSQKVMNDVHFVQDKRPEVCVFLKNLSEAKTESQ